MEALRLELLRDVGRRDRAEQLAFVADARREGERHLLELFRDALRRAAPLVLGGFEAIAFLLNALQVARRRLVREAVRKEVVAGVAGFTFTTSPGLPRFSTAWRRMISMIDSDRIAN